MASEIEAALQLGTSRGPVVPSTADGDCIFTQQERLCLNWVAGVSLAPLQGPIWWYHGRT